LANTQAEQWMYLQHFFQLKGRETQAPTHVQRGWGRVSQSKGERGIVKEKNRETDRERETDKHRKGETDKHREQERGTDKQRERDTHKEKHQQRRVRERPYRAIKIYTMTKAVTHTHTHTQGQRETNT
jgi:hypothetical protein